MTVNDLDTPALLVDMAAMEHNLSTMARFYTQSEVKLRPHFKNHRVLSLASRQMDAGAIGMTCARLGQAETLVHHGIKNVLIANEIAGEGKIKRFAELSGEAPVMVAVDNPKIVDEMAVWGRNKRVELNVVVEVDVGLNRCGVKPGEEAVVLAKRAREKGLKLHGIMGYEGHLQPLVPGIEKEQAVRAALQGLLDSRRQLEGEGVPVEIVSCGGTGDYAVAGRLQGVTENQAGSYLLMDKWYEPFAPDFKMTLTVLATVISKAPGRIVADAGVKALSGERGLPAVKGIPGLRLKALHAEHALIEIDDPTVILSVGDRIEIWVQYHDGTVNLHHRMYGIRNGQVEHVFQIEN